MSTKNIVPRTGSEGSIGTSEKPWGSGIFDTGSFGLVSSSLKPNSNNLYSLGNSTNNWWLSASISNVSGSFEGDGSRLQNISIEYSNILNKPSIISSSNQVDYTLLQNIPSGLISGSEQVFEFGYTISSSEQILLGQNLISSSQQITDFGFLSESYSTNGTGIISSSNQVLDLGYAISSSEQILLNNDLISSSEQVESYGFITESITELPNGLVSSSNQIFDLGYTISSSEQILIGNNLFSSSNQITGLTTSSINDFDANVSASAAASGFGSGGGSSLNEEWLIISASSVSNQSQDLTDYRKIYIYGDGNVSLNFIQTSSIDDTILYYYEIHPTGSQTLTVTNDVTNSKDNFGSSIPVSGSETLVGNMFKNPNGQIRWVVSPLE